MEQLDLVHGADQGRFVGLPFDVAVFVETHLQPFYQERSVDSADGEA